MSTRKQIREAAGRELGHLYADMWDLIVRAAHRGADGMPRMQEIAVEVSWEFVRARQRWGQGTTTLEALRWLIERLEKKMAKLRQLEKEKELAEENDLPTVEELERTDWKLYEADTGGTPAWHGAVTADDHLPYTTSEDPDREERLNVETITVRPTVRMQVENTPGRTRWIGLGFNVELGAIVMFKGREYP